MIHTHAQGGEDFADAEAPRGAARGDLLQELRGAFLRLDIHIYMGVCMYMYIYGCVCTLGWDPSLPPALKHHHASKPPEIDLNPP